MSVTPRLTFLWPFLFKPARPCVARPPRRGLRSSAGKRQELATQRYGTANEPPPELGQQQAPVKSNGSKEKKASAKSNTKEKKEAKAAKKDGEVDTKSLPRLPSPDPGAASAPSILSLSPSASSSSTQQQTQKPADKSSDSKTTLLGPDTQPTTPPPPPPLFPSGRPLETVLNMPSPAPVEPNQIPQQHYDENASPESPEHKPPHISTPRYVHHFDTYSLVKRLTEGTWREDQAVTAMKAVRLILTDNIELAREGLVSKSNVENETYLFRAACSELRTEVGMRRKAETEKTRSEKTGLQHEVDILGQRVAMETAGLKEELKGMVEGRKMAVREEGRSVDSKIQELNYRITVALNSDSRSDVEMVRWIITKRAIAALATCVLMVIGSLKYASTAMQEEAENKKRLAALQAQQVQQQQMFQNGRGRQQEGGNGGNGNGGTDGIGEIVVSQGDNPSFVSLG